jgi:hypothetical protein
LSRCQMVFDFMLVRYALGAGYRGFASLIINYLLRDRQEGRRLQTSRTKPPKKLQVSSPNKDPRGKGGGRRGLRNAKSEIRPKSAGRLLTACCPIRLLTSSPTIRWRYGPCAGDLSAKEPCAMVISSPLGFRRGLRSSSLPRRISGTTGE